MHTKNLIRRVSPLFAAMLFLASAQSALAAAGKALFVSGSVNLERNGTRPLKVNDPVNVGDVVATGDRSRAQLLMADGARIALRAGTRFRVDQLALPTNVQQPGLAVAVASSGKSVTTLLKGGFSTRDGAIAKSNPAAYEMRTPVGTLGIRGTFYSAVLCRGDCADAPGLPPGQPIADGLYIAVDEGTITFNGRGLSLTLTAPAYEFIPLETGDPQPLANPPAFLRNDGAGALQLAGRPVRIAAVNSQPLSSINERRAPTEGTVQTSGESSQAEQQQEGDASKLRIAAVTPLGRAVDITDPQVPLPQQMSLAAATPAAGQQAGATTSATQLADTFGFSTPPAVGLVQFDAPFGAGTGTYVNGTATILENGTNGATGIRWGRWSGGSATVNTAAGAQTLNLTNSSLHWIIGPTFELQPVLPVSGTLNFTLAGGTNPTDDAAHVGTLGGAVLAADFTAQQVSSTLSLDVNGNNWFASGTGPITAGTVRFGGAFNNVIIAGRVRGTGSFSGFFSAGAATPDQLNGVGLSYRLVDSLNQLGTVSGVAGFVSGTGQAPTPPQQASLAAAVPAAGQQAGFTTSATQPSGTFGFDVNGGLVRFDALFGAGTGTYVLGTASLLDTGNNAASGIRWGRWSGGSATVNTTAGAQTLNLTNSSLHWITAPTFVLQPVLPVTGTQNFIVAGGTNPTDDGARVGTLGGAVLAADFTAQQVSTTLSLDINGYNWFATGTGAITAGAPRFGGAFNGVLIDGRVPGTGSFNGFFSADTNTPNQLNGVGFGYRLVDSLNQLGSVSGVIAFVPGSGQAPTPPVVSRDFAFTVGGLDGGPPLGLANTNTVAQLGLDANGNLIAFVVPVTRQQVPTNGTFQLGAATVVGTGTDAATGLRWGRWQGGPIDLTLPPAGPTPSDLGGGQLHWIVGTGFGAAPALPQSGTATYALVGNTVPTDIRSNLGTVGAASFSADFTNLTVASALSIDIGGFNWYANGTGTLTQATRQFTGTYNTVSVQNLIVGGGAFDGFFTVPRIGGGTVSGAGLEYILQSNTPELGVVNGVLAFAQGQGTPVPPPPLQSRDIAVMAPIPGIDAPYVQTTTPAGYAVDGTFSLTRLTSPAIPTDPVELGVIDIGSSTMAETNASALTMLRWGRWADNSATFTGVSTGQTGTIDLKTSSLHWVETADLAGPPIMPTTGTASYVLGGATSPTDRAGNVGTLNAATFDADFTNQLVATSVDLTINNQNWVASGTGTIGAQLGLPAHQFAGQYTQGIINPIQGSVRGEFAGFFSAPGSKTPGVPGGVGLTYSLQDGQGLSTVDGAIVFQGP